MKYEAAGPVNFKNCTIQTIKDQLFRQVISFLNYIIGAIHVFTGNRFKLNGDSGKNE